MKCGKMVEQFGSSFAYPCDVDPPGHEGPCASGEVARSLVARETWVAKQLEEQSEKMPARPKLDSLQARPVTTAESLTENPTPRPGEEPTKLVDMADELEAAVEQQGLRQRPEDQRLPVAANGPLIHRLVQDDLEGRLQLGISRYGQPLQAHNGRNAALDAYEETLDQAVYLRTLLEERADMLAKVVRVTAHLEGLYQGIDVTPAVVTDARELAAWLGA